MTDSTSLDAEILEIGRELAAAFPKASRRPLKALDDKAMDLASQDAELKAALFRFVDVVPACRVARRPRPPPHRLPRRGRREAAAAARRDADGRQRGRAQGARRRGRRRRAAHGAPLHRRRDAEGRARRLLRSLWKRGIAHERRPARRGDGHADRGRPLRGAARGAATTRASTQLGPARARADAPADPARTSPSRSPRSRRSCAPTRPSAARRDAARRLRELLRRAKRARRAPAHRHGVARLARGGDRPRPRPARRGRVPRRPQRRRRAAGLPARRRRPARPPARLRDGDAEPRAPARRPPRQGRVLGPRGRRGPPARLGRRRSSRTRPSRDRTFERLTRRLLDARDRRVRPAIASHNLRSVAHAIAVQPPHRRAPTATSSSRSCAASATTCRTRSPRRGLRVRTYCPVGDLVAGMAYLVRRLLENTSNESFLQAQASGRRSRSCCARPMTTAPLRQRAGPRAAPRDRARRAARRAASSTRELPLAVPVWIGDGQRHGEDADLDRSRQPRPRRRRRARGHRRRRRRGGRRRRARLRAAWAADPGRRARRDPRRRRGAGCASAAPQLAALAVRECAKPWAEADADVCEAIDFLEYYAREAVALGPRPAAPPGRPASATSCATPPRGVVRGHRAVELPARDPAAA